MLFFSLFLCLFISRMVFPAMAAVFAVFALFYISYLTIGIIKRKLKVSFNAKKILKSYRFFLLVIIPFLGAILYSIFIDKFLTISNLSLIKFFSKDIIHILVYIFIILILSLFVNSKDKFEMLLKYFSVMIFSIAVIASILGLIKYISLLICSDCFENTRLISSNINTSLLSDYNSYSFMILFGLISYTYLLTIKKSIFSSGKLTIYIYPLFLTAIYFSSSRRGFILILVVLIILLILSYRSSPFSKIIKKKLKAGLLACLIFMIIFVGFIKIYSYQHQKDMSDCEMCMPNNFTRSMAAVSARYFRVISEDANYLRTYRIIWGCYDGVAMGYYFDADDIDASESEEERKKKLEMIAKSQSAAVPSASRTDRYLYAYELFNSGNTTEKIIGQGFHYIKLFADKFSNVNRELQYDYPHNFLISAFLYSGIVGSFILLIFFLHLFYVLTKTKDKKGFFVILFLLGSLYSTISGNTIFSTPFFVIIIILILTNYSIQKEHDV